MKHKNKLIEVFKNTVLLNTNYNLFSKKYDNVLYAEPKTYEDIIDTPSSSFTINSDSVFDRPTRKKTSNEILNKLQSKNKPLIAYIESDIKKNINILPNNFVKILETENIINSTPYDINKNIVTNRIIGDKYDPISSQQEPIPDLYTTQQESSVTSKESFDPISSQQEPIPDLYTTQQESSVTSKESFDPISSQQEPIPDLYTTQQESSVTARTSFDPISSQQEPIPDLYTTQQESSVTSKESFDPISFVKNNIIPDNFSFPIEKQESQKDNNLYHNTSNSIDTLKQNIFERKLRNGKYYPDITEVNRIKRNLFTDIVGSGLIQSNLNKELQEISAFKYGGVADPGSVILTGEGGKNENIITTKAGTTIIPEGTPNALVDISRTPGEIENNSKQTSQDENEKHIVDSFLVLNNKINEIYNNIPPKEKIISKPIQPNQIRVHNNSIQIYYNSFV